MEKKRKRRLMAPRKSCIMGRWAILESWDLDFENVRRQEREAAFLQSEEAKAPQTSTTGTPSPGVRQGEVPLQEGQSELVEKKLTAGIGYWLTVFQMTVYQLIRRTCRRRYDRENMKYKVSGMEWAEDNPR